MVELAREDALFVPVWRSQSLLRDNAAGEPEANNPDYVQGAKGVDGGAVRLLGEYA